MDELTEYQLAWEQVNKLIQRRQTVSTIYLSVNTAIIGVIAFLVKDTGLKEIGILLSTFVLLIAGLGACVLWRKLILQYSFLLGWWYAQLRKLEDALPHCSRLINREYEELYQIKDGDMRVRTRLTQYEVYLTLFFIGTYFCFASSIVFVLVKTLLLGSVS